MAYTQLGAKAEGSIVKIRENGVLVDFYVAKQDYEPELNGTGRVLVVRKNNCEQQKWDSANRIYPGSDIDTWLNNDYKSRLETEIQTAIGSTAFRCITGPATRPIFLLSTKELGCKPGTLGFAEEGTELPIADTLRQTVIMSWARTRGGVGAYFLKQEEGRLPGTSAFDAYYTDVAYCAPRPTFTLPSFLCVTDDGEITTNTAPDVPSDLKKYTKMGSKAVGSVVKLRIDGVATDFIVVHQGLPGSMYDVSCDGTWLLSKDCLEKRQWHGAKNGGTYSGLDINGYLNNDWVNKLDADIKAAVKTAKIPYLSRLADKYVASGADGLQVRAFCLSATEVGFVSTSGAQLLDEGAKLSYFESGIVADSANNKRIAYLDGVACSWGTRSLVQNNADYVWDASGIGKNGLDTCNKQRGVRPTLILNPALLVHDDGTVTANVAPTTSTGISIPGSIRGGSTITILWGASTDAEGNLEGYTVERSTDGGSTWTQIYQGDALSTTNTVPVGTKTVMYRVRAYDSEGLYSDWRTSGQVTVINNTAPSAPASIAVPVTVLGGSTLDIIWETSTDKDGNLAGYSLERQVDGGSWETVYRGAAANYTDAITRGWTSVAYRVRAYDSYDAYSGYTLSATRSVNNNIAPVITCAMESGSDLGVQNEDFSVDYSASDADGDAVTITEAIDNEVVRRFTAGAGQEYTFDVTGETYMRLLNGTHTLTITANDGQVDAVHKLTFTKEITAASVTLKTPIEADDRITICVLSVTGSIPMDAHYRVVVTNNANDEEPVWEDCTSEVRSGANHIFANETAANGFAFNFRVEVERGESGQGGYINSVQGGFQ